MTPEQRAELERAMRGRLEVLVTLWDYSMFRGRVASLGWSHVGIVGHPDHMIGAHMIREIAVFDRLPLDT